MSLGNLEPGLAQGFPAGAGRSAKGVGKQMLDRAGQGISGETGDGTPGAVAVKKGAGGHPGFESGRQRSQELRCQPGVG